jgi:hypothetical protein
MAKLVVLSAGMAGRTQELSADKVTIGRVEDNTFQIAEPSVSSHHCEVFLRGNEVVVKDLDSTNGTFINGEPVAEAWLTAGQVLRFGDVELLVESTEAVIAIPHFERVDPLPPAPLILENGLTACPRHPEVAATFRCTHCKEMMCNGCVKVMRIQGGKPHYLCRLCSHPTERTQIAEVKKKKGFFAMLQDTVKLKFSHPRNEQK